MTDPLSLEEHLAVQGVGRVILDPGKELLQFFDEVGCDFLVGIDPEDPAIRGERKVVAACGGKIESGSALDARPKGFRNGDRVVCATGVEDDPFVKCFPEFETPGKVFGLVEAESANCNGKGSGQSGDWLLRIRS